MTSLGGAMPHPPRTEPPQTEPFHAEPVRRYDRTAMALHWIVAALILVNVACGLQAAGGDDGARTRQLVDAHKSIGLTVLGLVLLRVLWRIGHKPPPLPHLYPRVEKLAAHAAHVALYAVMLALPLSGYLHDSAWNAAPSHPLVLFGLLPLPRMAVIKSFDPATKEQLHAVFGQAHLYIGYALYALVGLHLLGVAKHHAVDHESEIGRMLPGMEPRS